MSYIEGFGYKVFRLEKAKIQDEFLLYNIKTKKYSAFNFKRLGKILEKKLVDDNFDLKKISIEYFKITYGDDWKENTELRKKTTLDMLYQWIEEEYILLDNFSYKPVDKLYYEEDGERFFNLYNKSKLLLNYSNKYKTDFKDIRKLIMNLVGNNKKEYDYFINWLAWQIKNPLQRLPTSIIFQGEHGTGKTMFCNLILKSIFETNFREIGQSDINKEYNDYIIGKQLIVANEVVHNDNKLLVPDKLKNYVTDEYLSINQKFKDTLYLQNYSQWIFVTNNQVPLKIERGDRRYSVFKSKKLKDGFNLITRLKKNHELEIKGFIYYLMSLNPSFEMVGTPYENEAKREVIRSGNNSIDEFIEYMKELGSWEALMNEYTYRIYNTPKGEPCIISYELYDCYKSFCPKNGYKNPFSHPKFTSHFKHLGYKVSSIWKYKKANRVLLLKNGEK